MVCSSLCFSFHFNLEIMWMPVFEKRNVWSGCILAKSQGLASPSPGHTPGCNACRGKEEDIRLVHGSCQILDAHRMACAYAAAGDRAVLPHLSALSENGSELLWSKRQGWDLGPKWHKTSSLSCTAEPLVKLLVPWGDASHGIADNSFFFRLTGWYLLIPYCCID